MLCRLRKIEDLDGKLFPFSQEDFLKNIHLIMQEQLIMSNTAFTITPYSFRHGGATIDYMVKMFSLSELKDRGLRKNNSTFCNYVQVAKSLIAQVGVTEESELFLNDLNSNAGCNFNVPEVRAGWEKLVTESQASP